VWMYGDGSSRRRLIIVGFLQELGPDSDVPEKYWRHDEPERVEWQDPTETGRIASMPQWFVDTRAQATIHRKIKRSAMVDTGANITLLKPDVEHHLNTQRPNIPQPWIPSTRSCPDRKESNATAERACQEIEHGMKAGLMQENLNRDGRWQWRCTGSR